MIRTIKPMKDYESYEGMKPNGRRKEKYWLMHDEFDKLVNEDECKADGLIDLEASHVSLLERVKSHVETLVCWDIYDCATRIRMAQIHNMLTEIQKKVS